MGRTYSFASATSASTIAVNIKASGVDIIHIAGTLNFDCGRDHPYIRGGPGRGQYVCLESNGTAARS